MDNDRTVPCSRQGAAQIAPEGVPPGRDSQWKRSRRTYYARKTMKPGGASNDEYRPPSPEPALSPVLNGITVQPHWFTPIECTG